MYIGVAAGSQSWELTVGSDKLCPKDRVANKIAKRLRVKVFIFFVFCILLLLISLFRIRVSAPAFGFGFQLKTKLYFFLQKLYVNAGQKCGLLSRFSEGRTAYYHKRKQADSARFPLSKTLVIRNLKQGPIRHDHYSTPEWSSRACHNIHGS